MIFIFKGVIFDLDGTLLDSMHVWETVDKIFLQENNVPYSPEISEALKTMSLEESAQFFIDEFMLTHSREYVINRIEEIVYQQYAMNIPLKPYVTDFLNMLDTLNIPYCIATATYASLADKALNRLGILERFKFILTCSEVGENKTSPKVYIRAAEKLGLKPNETAVIEDALHCIETAKNAGFFVVGIKDDSSRNDWNKIKSIADLTVLSFSDLLIKDDCNV